nr:hypothetical protein [Propionivibrio sp.]
RAWSWPMAPQPITPILRVMISFLYVSVLALRVKHKAQPSPARFSALSGGPERLHTISLFFGFSAKSALEIHTATRAESLIPRLVLLSIRDGVATDHS